MSTPPTWASLPLGDVLTRITYGFTNPMPTTVAGPYMVTARDISDGRINYETARKTSWDAYRRLTDKSRPNVGDVLLTKDGSVGRVAVCDREDVCINQSVALLQPRAEIVDSDFLSYLLQVPYYQDLMDSNVGGSTIKHIYITRVDKMTIVAPPLFEQRAISSVLGTLNDKITANDRGVILADQLARVLTMQSLGAEAPLAILADITMGSSPPGESYNENGVGMPFYQGVRDFGVRSPRKRVWTTAPVRMAEAQDTLLSVRAPVGHTNLATERICLGRGVAALRSRAGRAMTLFRQIRAADAAWAPYNSEGTVFGAINRGELERILIPTVREDLADGLERKLVVLEAWVAAALGENEQLATTRDEMLPLLMSGKLRVKDAEKIVEEVL